eukprot:COSAG02_NODE_9664_length_2148_cov_2.997072_2_plen_558_part_00
MTPQSARFLVVINIQDLFNDDQYKKLIDDYHNKLKELFGEANYKAVIGTLHFVLTHNDKTPGEPHTAKDVSKRLRTMVINFMKSKAKNSLLAEFVQRLISHNIIVNYDEQDQRFLGEKLLAFFDGADGGAPPQMDDGQLDVHANQLNSVCVRTIRDKIEQLKGKSAARKRAVDDLMKKLEREGRAAVDVAEERRTQKLEVRRSEKSLAENENALSELNQSLPVLKQSIEDARLQIGTVEEQQGFVRDQLTQIASVSLRADVAQQGGQGYKFRTVIQTEHGDANPTILVVADEPDDKSLKTHMDNDGSLIPADISKAQECTLAVVWFNNHKHLHKTDVLKGHARFDHSTGLTDVRFDARGPFKVLIYSNVDFGTTPASKLLKGHFDGLLSDATGNLSRLEQKQKDTMADSKQTAKRIKQIKVELQQQRGELEIRSEKVEAAGKRFDNSCAAAKQGIDEAEREAVSLSIGGSSGGAAGGIQATKCDVDVTYISQIEQIFRRNGLANDLTAYIEKYEADVAEMKMGVTKARADMQQRVDDFTKASEPVVSDDGSDDDGDQ